MEKEAEMSFFLNYDEACYIAENFGTPVYVYDETILRDRCRELMNAFKGRVISSFSAKANSNLALLKIIKEEGLKADAMSPGEIFILEHAGFGDSEIFYISNNVSAHEMRYAADKNILVSIDSLSQLDLFGSINKGGRVAVRFNPGVGDGHCDKVVTAGHSTKFGIQPEDCEQVKDIIKKHGMTLAGVNQHIGSLFLTGDSYVKAAGALLELVLEHFPGLEFIDFGGGFGVPYKPDEPRLDFKKLTDMLFPLLDDFTERYDNKNIHFKCEPGRYVTAECGAVLGQVHAVKESYGKTYVGTDIGFNVLMRPVLYDSYHEIKFLSKSENKPICSEITIVGNICESGDILASARNMKSADVGDFIVVANAGAYGYSMSSNYNSRLRPAEVLMRANGDIELIRKPEFLESLILNF